MSELTPEFDLFVLSGRGLSCI